MTQTVCNRDKELFTQAFELAYFIHAHKEVAFFIAEDSLEGLTSLLGYQKKNRTAAAQLRGFWKWGERTRPIRKTVILDEDQMLQWLVYSHSERWERETEQGQGFYIPTVEDLVVRYIKHLVFLTIRRGSFYVTLAICSLLNQFDRRETRVFYDVLTQNDTARMKDTTYIGKQRLELLDKVVTRLAGMLRHNRKTREGGHFSTEPADKSLITLVNESLRRFTPFGTSCVLAPKFDVTDIPELYFSEDFSNKSDFENLEDTIEMNRIHTVLHPECLLEFLRGLDKYVRTLPAGDLDAECDFNPSGQRIVLPQFTAIDSGPSRPDRFGTPKLTIEDYVRLQRTLDARGVRKKAFVAQRLFVYVDGVVSYSFEPNVGEPRCVIGSESSYVEIRGEDGLGEVILATLILPGLPSYNTHFEDSIVHAGGQKISLKLTPVLKDPMGLNLQLEIGYEAGGGFPRKIATKFRSTNSPKELHLSAFSSKLTLATASIKTLFAGIARRWYSTPSQLDTEFSAHGPISTPPQKTKRKLNGDAIVARASWRLDLKQELIVLPVELTRSDQHPIDLSGRETKISLSLPLYDSDGHSYPSYLITLRGDQTALWQETMVAPNKSLTGYAHILEVVLFNNRLPKDCKIKMKVEGLVDDCYHAIGDVQFLISS